MNWRDAERLIGRGEEGDYVLALQEHEDRYATSAPDLATLISSAGARSAAETYARFDRAAIKAQANYRKWMFRANLGALLTSVLSASAMALALLDLDIRPHPAVSYETLVSIAAAGAAALGATGLYWLRNGRLLETWMGKRAEAETQRISYFANVVRRASEGSSDLALLALEYFRRYHLHVQKTFFFSRARQHEKSAGRTVALGAAGAGAATLFSILGIAAEGSWQAVGALSVLGAALGSFAIGREQMTQDRRNAERYDRTYGALVALTYKLDEVREAVENGKAAAANEFAIAVNDQISNEHRQWLEETEATKSAIARIEAALHPQQESDKPAS